MLVKMVVTIMIKKTTDAKLTNKYRYNTETTWNYHRRLKEGVKKIKQKEGLISSREISSYYKRKDIVDSLHQAFDRDRSFFISCLEVYYSDSLYKARLFKKEEILRLIEVLGDRRATTPLIMSEEFYREYCSLEARQKDEEALAQERTVEQEKAIVQEEKVEEEDDKTLNEMLQQMGIL